MIHFLRLKTHDGLVSEDSSCSPEETFDRTPATTLDIDRVLSEDVSTAHFWGNSKNCSLEIYGITAFNLSTL